MPDPILPKLTRHFTNLIGRKVTFTQVPPRDSDKTSYVYGVYRVAARNGTVVVKADLGLLGSFAGALVGLPDSEVKRHLAALPIEELLRDAMHEVLNVASAVIASDERAVLTSMVTDEIYMQREAARLLASPGERLDFSVAVDGYQGGRFILVT